uniref:Small ribosomal subunit protein uS3 n=1 Tax=Myxobolus squamalis TaxID=59785 RepID=A0A6B2FZU4_MYXSQ
MVESKLSKTKQFVKNGLLYAEITTFFQRALSEDGYVGLEIRPRGVNTDIVLMVTRPQNIVGEKGRKIRELTALVQRKFKYEPERLRIYVDPIKNRNLSSAAQCEALKFKLAKGIPVRRACYTTIRSIMGAEARGCEVVVSGKIRGQRAKSMKFSDGIMIHSGHPVKQHVDFATRSVLLKQGVLGIKVKINKPIDNSCLANILPDTVIIPEPKSEANDGEVKIEFHDSPKKEVLERPPVEDQPRPSYRYRGYNQRGEGGDLSQNIQDLSVQ